LATTLVHWLPKADIFFDIMLEQALCVFQCLDTIDFATGTVTGISEVAGMISNSFSGGPAFRCHDF